jgi:hypothetical protein
VCEREETKQKSADYADWRRGFLTQRRQAAKKIIGQDLQDEQDLGCRGWDLGNNNRVLNRDGQDIQDKYSGSHGGHKAHREGINI